MSAWSKTSGARLSRFQRPVRPLTMPWRRPLRWYALVWPRHWSPAGLIGGIGAVELLACIMALRDGVIAPTIGYQEPNPDCALDIVPNTALDAKVSVVLSNAFAFGGMNAVVACARSETQKRPPLNKAAFREGL
jgi:hypothetical protein